MEQNVAKKITFVLGLGIILLASTGTLYFKSQADAMDQLTQDHIPAPLTEVAVYPVDRVARNIEFKARGIVTGVHEVTVSAEAAGRVLTRAVEDGQLVKAGDTVCRIDTTFHQLAADAARARLDEAEAARQNAEAELQRLDAIGEDAKMDIEVNRFATALQRARATQELAAAELAQATERVRRCSIRAPIDGVVSAVYFEVGELMAAGRAVAEIVNLDDMRLRVELTTAETAKLGPAPTVIATSPALPDHSFSGRLNAVYPKANPITRRVPVEILLSNPDHALRSGTFVNCTIQCQVATERLLVPAKGVLHDYASHYCLVAEPRHEMGHAIIRRQAVEIMALPDSITVLEIKSGLQPGDRLMLSNQLDVRPGQEVTYREVSAPAL